MPTPLEKYNASIVATAVRPYLYIHRETGMRYTFTQKQHDFYLSELGEPKLNNVYVIEKFPV